MRQLFIFFILVALLFSAGYMVGYNYSKSENCPRCLELRSHLDLGIGQPGWYGECLD
jgi:hypothetical protein